MRVVVATPPSALVTADEARSWAPVFASDPTPRIEALLLAAQRAIEPPHGWVGRAFGMQLLEARFDGLDPYGMHLPCPPLRGIASVKYDDAAGNEQTVPTSVYRALGIGTSAGALALNVGSSWPLARCAPEAVRVRFSAGYGPTDPELIPAKHAIVLAASHLRSLSTQDLALRSEDVPGVGARTWTVSDQAAKLVQQAVEGLLAGYRVWSV